jgi:predicted DNA-binding transcriptional regulator YafY
LDIIEAIIQAARERKLLRIQYKKLNNEVTERDVEVYEIKDGTRLYAWDIAKNDHIRQFIITGILQAEVLDQVFEPRYPILIE